MSIDSCYEGIIAKLTKQGTIVDISKKLLAQKNNTDRVLYVYKLINELRSFPKLQEVQKSLNVSIYYRNLGNNCFQNCEDTKAWQYYNLSLLHAPLLTDHYALALANRSAVFYSMKKYKECLEDIAQVFSMKYPIKLEDKLLKRQSMCQEVLAQDEYDKEDAEEKSKIEELLVMKSPKDPEYLCASTKLKVEYSEEMGRHVVAKEDISVGEILIQEHPYLVVLQKSQYLFSCSYCISRKLNLLPCNKCCFALYCSEECRESAWREYHQTECSLMATLIHMEFTKLELLALRTAIKARTDHKDWPALFNTICEAESNQNNKLKGFVKVDDKWVFDSKYYASIHTLATNIEKRSISDIFQKAVTAAVFFKFLTDATDFMNSEDDVEREKIRKCVAGMLLLHGMTSPTNMHGLSSNMESKLGNFVEEISIASAPYAFHSLLNHSCSPNSVRFSKLGTGQMTLFALRPIKKGMQVFDNYGSHHAMEDRASRNANLKFQYKFNCFCEACIDNWPTYLRLKPGNIPHSIQKTKQRLLNSITIEKLQKGDKSFAYEVYKPLCELAEALEPYAPCLELADCQESLKQCLVIFEGVVPYGYGKLVDWKAVPPKV